MSSPLHRTCVRYVLEVPIKRILSDVSDIEISISKYARYTQNLRTIDSILATQLELSTSEKLASASIKVAPILFLPKQPHKKQTASSTLQAATCLPPSLRTQLQEKMGLLRCNTADEPNLLCRDLICPVPDNFCFAMEGGDRVSHNGLRSLCVPQWINNEVVNGYLQRALLPKVNQGKVYFFISFLMSNLLQTGIDRLSTLLHNYDGANHCLWQKYKILGGKRHICPNQPRRVSGYFMCLSMRTG